MTDPSTPPADVVEAEILEAEPVTVVAAGVESTRSGVAIEVSSRQVVALAATGFVAGAATAAVVGRRAAAGRRRRKKSTLGEVVASNSFLVDVHLLKR